MRIAITAALGAGAVAGVLTLAACSSANGGTGSVAAGSPSTPVSAAAPSSVPAAASSLVPSTVPSSSTAASTASSSASSAASTPVSSPANSTRPRPAQSTPPASGPSNCTSAQLSVDGVRGGAQQGVETAGVIFTNTSNQTCALQGYPFAQLRYKGKPLGKPATNDPGQVRIVVLRPGAAAQSLLHAVTTCQAPLSDHVRTQAPGTDTPAEVELQLRGCSLSIDPLEAS